MIEFTEHVPRTYMYELLHVSFFFMYIATGRLPFPCPTRK